MRGRAVDGDDAAARLCADRVSGEALAVVQVVNLYLLLHVDAGLVVYICIDRARTLVFEFGMRDPRLVQFCFK